MRVLITVCLLTIPQSLIAQISDFDSIDFSKADSISRLYVGHSLKNREQLVQSLTKDLNTDVEKFRAIFRWVCENIDYDLELYHHVEKKEYQLKNKKKRLLKWRKKTLTKSYKRTISKKTALCFGYAKLIEEMSTSAGLTCTIVEGYGRNTLNKREINHAWNSVNLQNKWYLADATWSSGYVDSTLTRFTTQFSSTYFLTEPSYFFANHYPTKERWSFVYDKPTLMEFFDSPVKEEGFIRNKINQYSPSKGKSSVKKDSPVQFRFTSNALIQPENVRIKLKGNITYQSLKYRLKKDEEGFLNFTHTFTKKGRYKVLIYISGWLSFIYEVIVI